MATIEQRINQKLITHGFWIGINGPVPPKGMGGMKAGEIIERCKAEAIAEAAAPVDEIATYDPNVVTNYDPFWHEHNPWNDHILYVPIEELAACHMSVGQPYARNGDEILIYTKEMVLDQWHQHGGKLDAYILTGPILTAGVRYGAEGREYLSPGFSLPKLWTLVQKYGEIKRKSA